MYITALQWLTWIFSHWCFTVDVLVVHSVSLGKNKQTNKQTKNKKTARKKARWCTTSGLPQQTISELRPFWNESSCKTFNINISLICMGINPFRQNSFYMNGFAPRFVLKQRGKCQPGYGLWSKRVFCFPIETRNSLSFSLLAVNYMLVSGIPTTSCASESDLKN